MQDRQSELNRATESLRKSWGFIEPYVPEADRVVRRSKVSLRQVEDAGRKVDAYVKIYAHRKHPLQRFLRKGRSRTEVRNLLFFRSLGIPAPRVLAWGEKRNFFGRIVLEFIITEALAGTQTLEDFVAEHCPTAEDADHRELRTQMAEKLGRWTRAMHDAGFIHEDLKWRNVLACKGNDDTELFWIDCPKGRFYKSGAALNRKKLKDCATLDKVARLRCSKSERQAFVKAYLGVEATETSVREMCQLIEKYREGRFDAKDNFQNKHEEK